MSVPLAVSPGTLGPGLYLTVDLLAAAATAGTQPLKALIMAPRSALGDLVPDTEIRRAGSAGAGAQAYGAGTPGHLMLARFLEQNPTAQVDMMAPAASAGASATASITFAGAVTAARNVAFTICGRVVNVPWLAGEAPIDVAAAAILALNQQTNNLPVTASAGAAGVVVLTFKVPGPWGNDALYAVALQDGAGGTVGGAGSVSGALAGGSTEPDFSAALSVSSGTRYDFTVLGISNADAVSASATSNPGRLRTKITAANTGLSAKLQRGVLGCTAGPLAAGLALAKTGAIARNEPTLELVFCGAAQSLPCEFAAAETGDRMAGIALSPAYNRIGNTLENCFGAADPVASTPTAAQIEDALGSGVSIVSYNPQGAPIIVRPITTHSQDAQGGADRRILDTSQLDGIYAVANDLEAALPQEFPNANVIKDQQPGEEGPPAYTVEERDIKTFIVTRLRFWQRRGVVRQDKLDEALAAGTLIVMVNPSDATQVDIVLPFAIVPPLAKFGLYIQKVA